MADVPGLYELPDGQRIAWNGRQWVPVGRDFDPRQSQFATELEASSLGLVRGVEQLRAWIEGDEAALQNIAERQALTQNERSVISGENPLLGLLGGSVPYLAGAAAGGAALGPAGALPAAVGAGAADVALGGLSYGTPGERALMAGVGVLGAGAGPVAQGLIRQAGRLSPRAARVQQAIQEGVDAAGTTGQGAGGRITFEGAASPQDVSVGARLASRLLGLGRVDVDAQRLRQTQRARTLADQYGIPLSPAMRSGSRALAQVEESFMSNPYSATPGINLRNQYFDTLEQEAKEFLLPGSGTRPIDENFVAAVTDDIARQYEAIASKSNPITAQDIVKEAQQIAAPAQSAWTNTERQIFDDLLDNVRAQPDPIEGRAAWTLQRRFAAEADRRFTNGQFQEGIAFQSVADAIEEQLVKNAEDLSRAELNLLRKRYRVMRALRAGNAIDQNGLSMAKAYNSLKRQFPRELGEGRGFDEPEMRQANRFFDVLSVGNVLFRQMVGNSGTATRLALQDLTPQATGNNLLRAITAGLYYGEPVKGLGRAAATPAGAAGLGAAAGVGGVAGLTE